MSVLTAEQLRKRIQVDEDLIISPILDFDWQVQGSSINLRLGTKFIITKRAELAVLQPSKLTAEHARKFQTKVHLTFGSRFILHPGQLALAGTFEFISLPNDLCAYVVSRSKYGRTGLLVATATYVHPGWKGCLTLELINSGDAPIELRCGAPIAQLILHEAKESKSIQKVVPTGPAFPDLSTDPGWKQLDAFQEISDQLEQAS